MVTLMCHLMLAALRFGPREVITAVFAFSILAVLGTAQGFGPFVRAAGVSQSLMFLQSFIGVIAVTALTLAAAVAERKEAEKRKDEFISMASHELKTPLTTIKAFSQLLVRVLSHTKSMHAKVYAKKLEIQIDKLTRLVNDLLDLSRLQRNQFSLHKTFFSPEGLVREVAQNMQATTKKHTILLIVKKIPRLVYADRERIAQVLTNLISNAIKYSKSSQKIVITVASRHGQLIVSVKDKGIGIDREGQVKLFKRFSRVDDAQSKAIPGLGVGLYIANEIILAHEGRMWLESQLGKGSTFYFSLPTT